jgi:hypothetical protein
VYVSFDPTCVTAPPPLYSTLFTIKVKGGNEQICKVSGEVPEGKAEFAEKLLQFGEFATGSECFFLFSFIQFF